jgi:hypothetical protein
VLAALAAGKPPDPTDVRKVRAFFSNFHAPIQDLAREIVESQIRKRRERPHPERNPSYRDHKKEAPNGRQ